nr:MAG TPA: hypothetical protein [Caudoviricetes sp.]
MSSISVTPFKNMIVPILFFQEHYIIMFCSCKPFYGEIYFIMFL